MNIANDSASLSLLENGNLIIHVPLTLRRMQGRKNIISPQALDGRKLPGNETIQTPLVQALSRAFSWAKILETGSVKSIRDLAEALKVDPSYVSRIMRLCNLSPDIVAAIMAGKEPSGLSLARLVQPLPEDWAEQRRELGFVEL